MKGKEGKKIEDEKNDRREYFLSFFLRFSSSLLHLEKKRSGTKITAFLLFMPQSCYVWMKRGKKGTEEERNRTREEKKKRRRCKKDGSESGEKMRKMDKTAKGRDETRLKK